MCLYKPMIHSHSPFIRLNTPCACLSNLCSIPKTPLIRPLTLQECQNPNCLWRNVRIQNKQRVIIINSYKIQIHEKENTIKGWRPKVFHMFSQTFYILYMCPTVLKIPLDMLCSLFAPISFRYHPANFMGLRKSFIPALAVLSYVIRVLIVSLQRF